MVLIAVELLLLSYSYVFADVSISPGCQYFLSNYQRKNHKNPDSKIDQVCAPFICAAEFYWKVGLENKMQTR